MLMRPETKILLMMDAPILMVKKIEIEYRGRGLIGNSISTLYTLSSKGGFNEDCPVFD